MFFYQIAFIQSKRNIAKAELKIFNVTINTMCVDSRRKAKKQSELKETTNNNGSPNGSINENDNEMDTD